PPPLAGGAEETLPEAPGPAGEELEVLGRRRARAAALERLHGGLRGGDPGNGDEARAVVRRAGRPQVVHSARGGRRDRARGPDARARVPRRRRREAGGAGGGTEGPRPRGIAAEMSAGGS